MEGETEAAVVASEEEEISRLCSSSRRDCWVRAKEGMGIVFILGGIWLGDSEGVCFYIFLFYVKREKERDRERESRSPGDVM